MVSYWGRQNITWRNWGSTPKLFEFIVQVTLYILNKRFFKLWREERDQKNLLIYIEVCTLTRLKLSRLPILYSVFDGR